MWERTTSRDLKTGMEGEVQAKVEERIEEIRELLVERLDPNRIILFGSLASGIAKRSGYDIDLLVYGGEGLSHRECRRLREEIDLLAGIYTVDLLFADRIDDEFRGVVEETGMVIYEKGRD